MKTKSFYKIALKYKTIFFDAFGVLKNYNGLIPGVAEMFNFLDENGIDYYILTNDASRSPDQLAEKYQEKGIRQITVDKVISSGMLAKEYLENKVKLGSTVTYLGTSQSAHYIEEAGLKTISIADLNLNNIDDIEAITFLDDEGFDWQRDINKIVNLIRKKNIPVIIANTDLTYPVSKNEVAIAIGGLANMVEDILSKNFIRFGKPDAQMFMFAYEKTLEKRKVTKREIVMVGDTLTTDIIGGNKFGIDTVLVLSGNTPPERAELQIKSKGIIPTHICESVGE